MNYHYNILHVNKKERWITIVSDDRSDTEELDSFICLMKRIRDGIDGVIEDIGDTRYRIKGDSLGLIYQWDSCFGISVIYPEKISFDEAVKFLRNALNN